MRPAATHARPRRRSVYLPYWPTIVASAVLGLFVSLAVAWVGSSFAEVAAATIRRAVPPSAAVSLDRTGAPAVQALSGGADPAWALAASAAARPYTHALPPLELSVLQTAQAITLAASRESISCSVLAPESEDQARADARDRPPFGRLLGVVELHEIRAGFPFRAWGASAVEVDATMALSPTSRAQPAFTGDLGAILKPGANPSWTIWPSALGFALPYRPLWPGLIADAACYSAAYLLLRAALLALRGVLRRRRGLCPECAYPLGEYTTCPECGRANPSLAEP